MKALYVFFEKIDEFRLKIHYNQYSTIVQNDLITEIKEQYYKYLDERNLTKLRELGEFSEIELLPKQLDLRTYEEILMSAEFPIEVIWLNGSPISALLAITYNNPIQSYSQQIYSIGTCPESLVQKADLVLSTKSIVNLKKNLYEFTGWLHIDGHCNGEYLDLGERHLFREDLPRSILFLNGCKTHEITNGAPGIVCKTRVKDNIAKEFAEYFYAQALNTVTVAVALKNTIHKFWEKDISVLGYIWKGSNTFTIMQSDERRDLQYYFKDPSSKLVETFYLKERPPLSQYYSEEDLITWNNVPTTRTELFSGVLTEEQIEVNHSNHLYELPQQLRLFRPGLLDYKRYTHKRLFGTEPKDFKIKKIDEEDEVKVWNDNIIGISDLLLRDEEEHHLVISTYPAEFYDVVVTNLSNEVYLESYDKSIRDLFAAGPRLPSFKTSYLVNQIGVGALLFTSDNFLILQKRSKRTLLSHKTQLGITCSVTGYVKDRPEYYKADNPSIFNAVIAQSKEELSVKESQFADIKLIGASRALETGGSPSFRFIGRLNISMEEFKQQWVNENPKDHWEYTDFFVKHFPEDKNEIMKKLKRIGTLYADNLPSSTLIAFYFFEKALNNGYTL